MGINISLVRKIGYIDTEDEIVIGEPDWEVQKVAWWDSLRQAGDKEFINNIDWIHSNTWREYLRPKDFNQAVHWVIDNLSGSRKEDYIKALTEMINDDDLYFYISR